MAENKRTAGKKRPAISPEDRENQLIALAMDKVEERMLEGTATSQEYVHFLKLATTKERLEKEKLELELDLVKAKTELARSEKHSEQMYAEAIKAIGLYQGVPYEDEE